MVSIGYALACEEFGPKELVRQARMAEEAGFERLWISDHFHPWTSEQGNSPFVWSVIGALSEATSLPIITGVTCPTMRTHPAIIAQAAATVAVQTEGRFVLGVGTGEALNEHIFGDRWPPAKVRQDMLAEAIGIIRELHQGERVFHHGQHYTVEDAQLFTLPEQPVPIYVSAYGPMAARRAGKLGDGLCITKPDPSPINIFRDNGGENKPVTAGMKVCWAGSEEDGVRTAHRLWASEQLPGQTNQNLSRVQDFEQLISLVTPDMVRKAVPCGPDAGKHIEGVRAFLDAGVDEVYVQQIGSNHEEFFEAWSSKVLPQLR